jgi:hypothetical protein
MEIEEEPRFCARYGRQQSVKQRSLTNSYTSQSAVTLSAVAAFVLLPRSAALQKSGASL